VAYALGDEGLRCGVLRWAAAALLAGGVVGLIKLVLRRQRPREAAGFYSRRFDAHSFPSGHAARMGVAASLGPLVFPGWGWLGLPCALLVAWARVALGIHYVLDVAAGLAVGAAVALAVCWL
jgi:undecaprenyl-diphosphatase